MYKSETLTYGMKENLTARTKSADNAIYTLTNGFFEQINLNGNSRKTSKMTAIDHLKLNKYDF